MSDVETNQPAPEPVLQLRLVVEADDYESAVAFYRDALGLSEMAAFSGGGDAHVTILDAGRATLELANHAQRKMIDEVEVGHPTTPRLRVAFEVRDAAGPDPATGRGRARLWSLPPTETPWRSLNSRLDAPAGAAHHPVRGAHRHGALRTGRSTIEGLSSQHLQVPIGNDSIEQTPWRYALQKTGT